MIAAEGLRKSFGLKPAVEEISFKIGRGEVVGFLGPNGAAKSAAAEKQPIHGGTLGIPRSGRSST